MRSTELSEMLDSRMLRFLTITSLFVLLGAASMKLYDRRPFTVRVDLSDFRTEVLDQDGDLVASFPVTHGRPGTETPVGTFEITDLVVSPKWDDPQTPEKESIDGELGPRWLSINITRGAGVFGFHGLPARREHLVHEKIAGTSGCVGMLDSDIVKFADLVDVGTRVTIQE